MNEVYDLLQKYLDKRKESKTPSIAYFSMEYGLHDSLKIFSGGLGILAGDYLKEASDSNVNMVAVGLLYRYGYFKQTLNNHGDQIANYDEEHFSQIPVQPVLINDEWVTIEIEMPGRTLYARVWEVNVGSIKLYLLDTDFDKNNDSDRFITHHLYGGDNENRLKQEMVLGLGGIRVLDKIKANCEIYHCNEGHAAFIGLERIHNYTKNQQLTFAEAKEVVKASTLFTTHTPVPAGHDAFHVDLFKQYMAKYPEKIGISWDEFIMMGKAQPNEDHFNMSYLASGLSQNINGVSKLHGDVSKELLAELYPGYLPEELHIGYVTNGVHYSTWTATEWKQLHTKYFGDDFCENLSDHDLWNRIHKVPDEEIWKLKTNLKRKLIEYIKLRFTDNWIKRNENPKLITEALSALNPNALTIGFARRFATYKRAHLLFKNLDRLAKIVNNPERPVQFIFAGKAHPADNGGQGLIKYIVEISKRPEFVGKILFIQNYDMNLAKMLLQGVDVWLNTPTRPLEASGTSGEKGVMNGTMHFSVLDGWWVEGYKKGAGWALPLERSFDVQEFQDELDAETIYNILEQEIIPTYYDKEKDGVSSDWIDIVKNTISDVAPNFTTRRMINDYIERFYVPQAERRTKVVADDYKLAKELASWKGAVAEKWDGIEVVNVQFFEGITNNYQNGTPQPAQVQLKLNGLNPKEVGVEIVVVCDVENGKPEFVEKHEFNAVSCKDGICTYESDITLVQPGSYKYAIRAFAKHPELPHRMDFRYYKWI